MRPKLRLLQDGVDKRVEGLLPRRLRVGEADQRHVDVPLLGAAILHQEHRNHLRCRARPAFGRARQQAQPVLRLLRDAGIDACVAPAAIFALGDPPLLRPCQHLLLRRRGGGLHRSVSHGELVIERLQLRVGANGLLHIGGGLRTIEGKGRRGEGQEGDSGKGRSHFQCSFPFSRCAAMEEGAQRADEGLIPQVTPVERALIRPVGHLLPSLQDGRRDALQSPLLIRHLPPRCVIFLETLDLSRRHLRHLDADARQPAAVDHGQGCRTRRRAIAQG